jgi:hypothetical protein
MVNALKKLFNSGRKRVVAGVLTVGILTAGSLALLQPALTNSNVSAASCDKVNIVYCGFNASSDSGYISDFRSAYNKNSDNGHHDLKAVYRWAGATDGSVSGMNTGNTKIGTMDNHGNITVGGKTIGHDSKMAARFRESNWTGVVHVEGDVYARTVTPSSTAHNSYKVLVHFNSNGVADFAVAVTCGNAIKFTPVVPKPQLSCDSLTFSLANKDDLTYKFVAKASAKNTTITSYNFHFGDGNSKTVKTHATSASTTHSFAKNDHSYDVFVVVNSTRKNGVTSPKCHVTVKTPKAPVKPTLSCVSLTSSVVADQTNTYKFVAKAKASHTTITSYVFNFGDGKTKTVNTSSTSASTTHTFAGQGKSFTIKVSVNGKGFKNVTSANCKTAIKTPTPPKPSLTCVSLVASIVADQTNTYKFTATASAKNTTISSYLFDFGDGNTQNVATSSTSASATHTFAQADTSYTVKVSVSGKDASNVTSEKCQVTIKTPPNQESPQLICQNLSFVAVDGQDNTYKFTANADAVNTTITGYSFDFGDGNTQNVATDQTSADTTHTYANSDQDFTATVSVSSKDLQNVTSANCKVTVPKVPHQEFCKPGIPVGSPECQPCEFNHNLPSNSPECKPPVLGTTTELPNTGAGDVIGFFGATTIAGALIHRFMLRKRAV